jgi:hypothetical protein
MNPALVCTAFDGLVLLSSVLLCFILTNGMRRSPALDSPRPSPKFDEYGFRRTMNDIGRAYRNQAIELIAICRLFIQAADQGFMQDAELTR